jgi:hypothetical protein
MIEVVSASVPEFIQYETSEVLSISEELASSRW